MKITYFGHSAFLVEVAGATLLFDPFITGNEKAAAIDIKTLKPDYILISHGHGDHVGDTVEIAKNSGATVIANYEVAEWFSGKGVEKTNGLNLGGHLELPNIKLQLVPAWHSSVMPDGANGGTPAGFVVTHKDGTFYFSGDTALFAEMKLFARRNKIDVAFLCMGDHFTMDAVDAAHAAEFLNCDNVVAMHFDTFPPIMLDHAKAAEIFATAKKKLKIPTIGETFLL